MHNYEWFIENASKIHGDDYIYESETYHNTKEKMWMTHKKCGFRFQQTPKNHLRGQGCPKCGKEFAKTWSKRNYKNFLNTAEGRFGDRYSFPNLENEYENSHSKITIKCNLCNNVFKKIACDFICSKTGGCWCEEKKAETITHDELQKGVVNFIVEYFEGERIIKKDKVKITCKKCEYSRYAKISSLINREYKCLHCHVLNFSKAKILPLDEVKKRLGIKFPTIDVDYRNYENGTSILNCKCKKCGYDFTRSFAGFFNKSCAKVDPCPMCTIEQLSKKRTKTTEQFKDEVNSIYGNKYTVIGEYDKSDKKIEIRCNECNRYFKIEANSFLQGHGCPYHNCNSSGKEKEVLNFINEIFDDEVLTNDRSALNGKELDIFVPKKKIAIEFDGIFWHNENNKENNYHINKTISCEENGIRLIHIFEDEWIRKKDIWKSMISNIFGITKNRIFARKCDIREISAVESKRFQENNHIQGWCPSQIKIGLYYNDELVSLMTFGKSRHFVGNGDMQYEMLRFCNKINTNVVGGASKLFAYFIKKYNPISVVSYADRRWSKGNLYEKLGFSFDHYSKPNYYYVVGTERKNRFNFRKSVLIKKYNCPKNVSEKEFCRQQKWYRIYDCGTMVYKWFNSKN